MNDLVHSIPSRTGILLHSSSTGRPLSVAAAAVERRRCAPAWKRCLWLTPRPGSYLVGPLLENPHRVGNPLRGNLVGLHSARVGAYRIVYEIDPDRPTVGVISIDHPADVYRPR
ncbi:MAG: type II toxin-antitoxin system RelE/ParE family toxin [Acidimicrobiia bacterium]